MQNRTTTARLISVILHTPSNVAPPTPAFLLDLFRREFLLLDATLDRSFRGSGNAAARRQGIDTRDHGCGCDICVVYGGDCSYQMAKESHGEWHRARRYVRTRSSRQPKYLVLKMEGKFRKGA